MFSCLKHGWSSKLKPCLACHPPPPLTGMAAKFEQLHDLYAPLVEQPDGTFKRDARYGLISREDFLRLMDFPDLSKDYGNGG